MDTKKRITAEALGLPEGKIKWVVSMRVKHLRITVRTDRTIEVTMPWRCTQEYAEKYLQSKRNWIHKVFKKFEAIEQFQKANPTAMQDIDKGQDRLFARLEELAKQHGFTYRCARIRNQKTRWGSCSSLNNINLNIGLIKLPEHLQDYVILHELVHTVHKNHSKAFWAKLDEVADGKSKQCRQQMRQYRAGII
jgi:predicted metal-dependent hydrolase